MGIDGTLDESTSLDITKMDLVCAAASLSAYMEESELENIYPTDGDPWKYHNFIEDKESSVELFSIVNPKDSIAIISFRGTSDFTDTVRDLKAPLKFSDFLRGGHVSSSFYDGWKSVRTDAIAEIHDIMESYDITEFFFTGHSLGGAFATLAAADVVHSSEFKELAISLITFGAPLVGDQNFVELFHMSTQAAPKCYMHDMDPLRFVNSLILNPFGFKGMNVSLLHSNKGHGIFGYVDSIASGLPSTVDALQLNTPLSNDTVLLIDTNYSSGFSQSGSRKFHFGLTSSGDFKSSPSLRNFSIGTSGNWEFYRFPPYSGKINDLKRFGFSFAMDTTIIDPKLEWSINQYMVMTGGIPIIVNTNFSTTLNMSNKIEEEYTNNLPKYYAIVSEENQYVLDVKGNTTNYHSTVLVYGFKNKPTATDNQMWAISKYGYVVSKLDDKKGNNLVITSPYGKKNTYVEHVDLSQNGTQKWSIDQDGTYSRMILLRPYSSNNVLDQRSVSGHSNEAIIHSVKGTQKNQQWKLSYHRDNDIISNDG